MISRTFRIAPAALLMAACGAPAGREGAPRDSAAAREAPDSLHGSVLVYEFAELGGTRTVPILPPPDSELLLSAAELTQDAELLGNAGSLAFVKRHLWAYTCGAHGNAGASFHTMDLPDTTGPVIASPREQRALADGYRAEVVRAFTRDTTGSAPFTPESISLTLVRPDFRGPELAGILQFTADACYACSDGSWSSYTRSVQLPARELPAALAAHAAIPDAVRSFFRAHRPDSSAGWSAVTGQATRRVILASRFGVPLPTTMDPEYLVWWRADSAVTTSWIRAHQGGFAEIGQRPGVIVMADGVPWEWRSREVPIPLTPCSMQQ